MSARQLLEQVKFKNVTEAKMKRRLAVLVVLACTGIMIVNGLTLTVHSQGDRWAGRFISGTAYFIGGGRASQTRQFSLRINRLTSSSEVQELNRALQSGGQDELLRMLSKMNAGRVTVGTGVGLTANAIIATNEGRSTKLIVLYERNLGFGELRYGRRSQDYRFGYAELYLGRGGNEGMLIPAAFIRLKDGTTWEVEDFGTFPARLMGLRVRGGREEN